MNPDDNNCKHCGRRCVLVNARDDSETKKWVHVHSQVAECTFTFATPIGTP